VLLPWVVLRVVFLGLLPAGVLGASVLLLPAGKLRASVLLLPAVPCVSVLLLSPVLGAWVLLPG